MHGADEPLFADKIYAWKHGPVVQSVYNHYAGSGAGALPIERRPTLPSDIREFLDDIYRVFGRYSAWVLRDMTHKEAPWLKNFKPDVKDIEIPLRDLVKQFRPYVKKQK
jgi:uncharacterized phage-associated protein